MAHLKTSKKGLDFFANSFIATKKILLGHLRIHRRTGSIEMARKSIHLLNTATVILCLNLNPAGQKSLFTW
jgi:hypothetical protein